MRQITVTIVGGKATVATSGFSGSECLAETAALEEALGKVQSSVPTAEMRQMPTKAGVKIGGGR